MIDGLGSGRQEKPITGSCGSKMESSGRKKKRIKTLLGDITLKRSIFVCPACGKSHIPADELLDVVMTGFSPGIRKLKARAGQRDTFKEVRDDLNIFAEVVVNAKDVERVAEGTGQEVEKWQ